MHAPEWLRKAKQRLLTYDPYVPARRSLTPETRTLLEGLPNAICSPVHRCGKCGRKEVPFVRVKEMETVDA